MLKPTFLLFATLLLPSGTLCAQSSQTDDRFRRALERFPEADLDKDGILKPEELRQFQNNRPAKSSRQPARTNAPKPTHADVAYGDHPQQTFDIWLADTKDGKSSPLCIYIHGGGFRGGDKRVNASVMKPYLENGISFASMNYRLTNGGEFPYPTAMHDAARGLQFIRSKAKHWNIDPERIVCYGGSAGAGISLWLAFHDDLADPESDDPVARKSTRILAAGSTGGQSTYDMRTFREWFGVPDLPVHDAFFDFYAIQDGESADTPRVARLAEDASPINHLSPDDVPVYMSYSRENSPVYRDTEPGAWVHHPLLGLKLKEAMNKLNLKCYVSYPGHEERTYPTMTAFLIEKLSAPTP